MLFRGLIAIGILLLASEALFGQQVVRGVVRDAESDEPIPFASVGILGTSQGTSTNQEGEFSVTLKESGSLKITCIGFESIVLIPKEEFITIRLKPTSTQLDEVVIFQKAINPRGIVRKAFARAGHNFDSESFTQRFFYRHYCKDDSTYGRLIEAFVNIWKENGYRTTRKSAGQEEQMQVTQLRRSLDRTIMAQGHEPIAIGQVLQVDLVGYQSAKRSDYTSFYGGLNDLKVNFENYEFAYRGVTTYDGEQVYRINYSNKPDSILTTSGYHLVPSVTGTLYITTEDFVFIRTSETRTEDDNQVESSAYYRRLEDKYYPYHFIQEGKNYGSDGTRHWYHIELMSVAVKNQPTRPFSGWEPDKEDLRKIPYDSMFWSTNTILKTTPLEEDIIYSLGGGASMQKQFAEYNQYEENTTDGGEDGENKFEWLREYQHGKTPVYLCIWSDQVRPNLLEFELFKRLNKQYRGKISFVMLSTNPDEEQWRHLLMQYNLYADGMIQYRIKANSPLLKEFRVSNTPTFILISDEGRRVGNVTLPSELIDQEDLFGLLTASEAH